MGPLTLLLLHEEAPVCRAWSRRLLQEGFSPVEVSNPEEALRALARDRPSLLICGETLSNCYGVSFGVAEIHRLFPHTPIVFVAARGSEEVAVRAFRAGVSDYVSHPWMLDELVAAVGRVLERAESASTNTQTAAQPAGSEMIGISVSMNTLKLRLARVAASDSNVLITGETGTGKELAAQFIHSHSPRRSNPFACINCAAIPDSLVESELFGYQRGAFTGAVCASAGQLERANGGTVFLDEIGEMSPLAQAKILRVIEGKEVTRLGAKVGIRLNIRFIAATNQDLEQLIREHKFRSDLYFRLNIARVPISPLRERREDIPVLLDYYVGEMNRRFNRKVEAFGDNAHQELVSYSWPGNVRELKNLVEAIFVNLPDEHVNSLELPPEFCRSLNQLAECAPTERERIVSALLCTKWNKSKAAKQLHWSRMTLYRKIAKYQICA